MPQRPVLVTGATGYVGGRLVPILLEKGRKIRAAGRSVAKIRARPWGTHPNLEAVQADLHDHEAMLKAAEGCSAAYYLVHSMYSRYSDFSQAERLAAYNMVEAANAAGLEQLLYLGGLGEEGEHLSKHLRSRAEVGRILGLGKTPLTAFRAAMILGSGSASFETMRYLVDRLPVMVTPKWVNTKCQPISIANVLVYLAGCLGDERAYGRTFDIGGPDVLTYAELFDIYRRKAGLPKRIMIKSPLLTTSLSAYWVGLITPLPSAIARPLAEGLRNEVICREHSIREIVPQRLSSCSEAIRRALEKVDSHVVDTCCHDACFMAPPEWALCGDAPYAGGAVQALARSGRIAAPPETVWQAMVAGENWRKWLCGSLLWRLSGVLDKVLGGVGLGRGRHSPDGLKGGDTLEFWRVMDVAENKRLLLLAELKAPGRALLDIGLEADGQGGTTATAKSVFLPRGVGGHLYYYSLAPLNILALNGVVSRLAKTAGAALASAPKKANPGRPQG